MRTISATAFCPTCGWATDSKHAETAANRHRRETGHEDVMTITPNPVLVDKQETASAYRIEIFRDACCADHPESKWYEAKIERAALRHADREQAMQIFRRVQSEGLANYRLVLREESHTVVETVVAS